MLAASGRPGASPRRADRTGDLVGVGGAQRPVAWIAPGSFVNPPGSQMGLYGRVGVAAILRSIGSGFKTITEITDESQRTPREIMSFLCESL
ncbi:protein of unknown function [Candidatus Promineifilum breve]|uniref:Uncharacterized protein n=1 Tax=Candidatus Promineifilum breve TaxID=1806508 RepID=A0A160T0Y2_9CHLR|nr:protein of unknown function [Candidatus Promineifilum breve]